MVIDETEVNEISSQPKRLDRASKPVSAQQSASPHTLKVFCPSIQCRHCAAYQFEPYKSYLGGQAGTNSQLSTPVAAGLTL